ncbi:MAG: HlyC/CorC family transporter [Firmicutes bacterium]|nr:HlyC/CorC family transporter [Bacillota bacterium]
MESDMVPLWSIICFILIIAAGAYVVAVERALSAVNKMHIRQLAEDGNTRAEDLEKIIDDPGTYMPAMRAASVLMTLCAAAFAVLFFLRPIEAGLVYFGVREGDMMVVVAIGILILLLALVMCAFTELLPRRLAVLHPDGIAMFSAGVCHFLIGIMKPMTAISSGIVYLFLKLFRQRIEYDYNEYSEEDIVSMLEAGQEKGELKEEGKKMITGVFAFDDLLAYEVMTPRTDVFAIDINDPSEEYIDELMELRFSRIPVYEDDSDNIIGILYIKDYLIQARESGFDNVDIRAILRTPYFVPETKNIDSLFVELQKTKQHIAILIDEYGGFSGIVTMEDIIEEVMGEIDDEYDEEEPEIKQIRSDTWQLDGSMDLDDIDEELGIDLESESSETIGGFLIDILGEIPDDDDLNQPITYENYIFTILSVKDRRIESITLKILPKETADETEKDKE